MGQPHQPAQSSDTWADSAAYEAYIGRWSRLVARDFLSWLAIEPDRRWLDIGSGSGALARAILDQAQPREIKGSDRSTEYIRFLREAIREPQITFEVADAQSLPFAAGQFDVVVAGLVLNFISQPQTALREMARVTQPGGTIAAYVWDYAGQMQMLRYFWDAVIELHPELRERDEASRFPLCRPDALQALFAASGLHEIAVQAIDIETRFRDFDDYWTPFLGGQGPAPTYVAALPEEEQTILRERIRARLPFAADGSIPLVARAWAVRGRR